MSISDKIERVDKLRQEISNYGNLPEAILNKINYKFRLEWNYTSNNMEGNTLTKRETRTVMVGLSVNEKPIKDVIEMKNHDDVISTILKIGKGDLNISETRIKEIHKGIMYEDDHENAKQIGIWKNKDNHIILNEKGEKIDFVPHVEVPARMHLLINWLNTEKEKIERKRNNALHPAELAFQFHLEYITIHPFYDGNGRTARILSNLILISFGYPPIYIKDDEKGNYYQYLADIQGYGGDPDLFYEFMTGLLIRSQQIILDAIQGREIEEPDDLDKRLALLDRELEIIDIQHEIKEKLSLEVFNKISDNWLKSLLIELIKITRKFNRYYKDVQHSIHINNGSGMLAYTDFSEDEPGDVVGKLYSGMKENENRFSNHDLKITYSIGYGSFKKGGLKTFGCRYNSYITFDSNSYKIEMQTSEFIQPRATEVLTEKLLHQGLTNDDAEKISKHLGDALYQHIDHFTKEKGIR